MKEGEEKKYAPVVRRKFSIFTFCDGQKKKKTKKKTPAWREHVNSFKTGFGRMKPAELPGRFAFVVQLCHGQNREYVWNRFPHNIRVRYFGCWFGWKQAYNLLKPVFKEKTGRRFPKMMFSPRVIQNLGCGRQFLEYRQFTTSTFTCELLVVKKKFGV